MRGRPVGIGNKLACVDDQSGGVGNKLAGFDRFALNVRPAIRSLFGMRHKLQDWLVEFQLEKNLGALNEDEYLRRIILAGETFDGNE